VGDVDNWLRFVLAVLATWRVTHLLAREDGPADLIFRLRVRLGEGLLGRLMDCFNCLSLWVAAPIALLLSQNPIELALIWPALSGGACLLERVSQTPMDTEAEPQVAEEDSSYGMLWSEENKPHERIEDQASSSPAIPPHS
jgi:hypothetical protein